MVVSRIRAAGRPCAIKHSPEIMSIAEETSGPVPRLLLRPRKIVGAFQNLKLARREGTGNPLDLPDRVLAPNAVQIRCIGRGLSGETLDRAAQEFHGEYDSLDIGQFVFPQRQIRVVGANLGKRQRHFEPAF